MANFLLLSSLVTQVRQMADMEAGGPVSDPEIRQRLLSAAQRLHDRLVAARGQEYYRVTRELVTIPGQALYPLPEDFYKILAVSAHEQAVTIVDALVGPPGPPTPGVFVLADSGDEASGEEWSLLRPFEMLQLPGLLGRRSSCASETRYRVRGAPATAGSLEAHDGADLLELRPVPGHAWTLRLDYIPLATSQLSEDDLVLNGINGFEQVLVLEVAMYCLGKEESDARHLAGLLAQENARIELMATTRDHGSPEQIVDTEGLLDGAWLGGDLDAYDRRLFWRV